MCVECGGTVIEYDAAAGNGFCVACGTVVEENTIVNEVRNVWVTSKRLLIDPHLVANVWRDEYRCCDGTRKLRRSRRKYVQTVCDIYRQTLTEDSSF